MASKKQDKKSESKKNDETKSDANAQPKQPEKRFSIVQPKLVFTALEQHGLPTDGTEEERTNRLASYYLHEERTNKISLAECQPDGWQLGDEVDPTKTTGCFFMSDQTLPTCPFCGDGGEVSISPPPAAPPSTNDDVTAAVNVATKKAIEKKKESVAKVSSKDVKNKKKARGAAKEDVEPKDEKPATEPETAKSTSIVKPEVEALDLPSATAGGTIEELVQAESEIDALYAWAAKAEADTAWEVGRRLIAIRDKKLYTQKRNEDKTLVYATFGHYLGARFDMTTDYASKLIRIAALMSKEDAEAVGVRKALTIIGSQLPDNTTKELIEYASGKDKEGKPLRSFRELENEIRKIKNPQLPAGTSSSNAAVDPDGDDDEEHVDLDDDDSDDLDEEDSDDEPESKPAKTKEKPKQLTSISFEAKTFEIPLHVKGSQIKPAKKIQDEPHGMLLCLGGTKMFFRVEIGENAELKIVSKIETPY
jgi:hypothetical protein